MDGHRRGAEKTVDVVKQTFRLGVETVTLFLFSTENWGRPPEEINNIMELLNAYLSDFSAYLVENKIEVHVIGQTGLLAPMTQQLLRRIGYKEADPSRTLCLAISYGGRNGK
jgi:undecaprenyl diphosphate synthase